ncbi:basal layer antifungal protein 2 precursor [Zea mays]|uniref:Uncharacterized protein n=1 Tax=Zea mays TaxID=4577 RepID=B4FEV8_MAIZE|nr:basal layer antifungal protein 2 precursor [Zea mays]ACF80651.1 unknown [Zea mays]ACG26478.1 hypothetical protein [Zea mays]AQK50830.1 hypothetical protein ZEAMMB73_Zm00001d049576 [Zea mays]|eukprot:NP_001131993.1 basal layer antifungal protein 2 precursor [Zea mays]
MAKCSSFQGLFWLLSMILLASFVAHARTTSGHTKEDSNARNMTMTKTRASGNILVSRNDDGPCYLDSGLNEYVCRKTNKCYKSLVLCVASCQPSS